MLLASQIYVYFGHHLCDIFEKRPYAFCTNRKKIAILLTKLLRQIDIVLFHFLTYSESQMIILSSLKKEKLTKREVCGPIVHQSRLACRSRKKASNQKEDEKLHSNYSTLSSTCHFNCSLITVKNGNFSFLKCF